MKKILFLCLGNICRSPLAEEVFRQKVAAAGRSADFDIDSAGLIDNHEGQLADPRMRDHAYRHGYRLTHRSRPITDRDFAHFDHILAMDADNLRRLRAMAPNPQAMERVQLLADYLTQHPDFDHIPDPYYGGTREFEEVIDLCEDACTELLNHL